VRPLIAAAQRYYPASFNDAVPSHQRIRDTNVRPFTVIKLRMNSLFDKAESGAAISVELTQISELSLTSWPGVIRAMFARIGCSISNATDILLMSLTLADSATRSE
jgi:hypothetical protein